MFVRSYTKHQKQNNCLVENITYAVDYIFVDLRKVTKDNIESLKRAIIKARKGVMVLMLNV